MEGQGDDEEEEPEEIQMGKNDGEDPGETVEDTAMKQDVIFSRIGQSYTFTIKSRDVPKYGPHLRCQGCKYFAAEFATQFCLQQRVQDQDHGRDGEMTRTSIAFASGVLQKESMKGRSVSMIMMQEEHAKEERMESEIQEQPAQKTCTCWTPVAAAATWQCEELRRDMMTNKVVQKSNGPRQAARTATWCVVQ